MIVILNVTSLLTWSYSFIRTIRIKYVTTRLKLILIRHLRKAINMSTDGNSSEQQHPIMEESLLYRDDSHLDFARNYLKCDGIFVLRLLETNTSDFVVTHVIEELFYSYEKKASQPVVLDGLAKMMSTLGPDQGLLSLGKLLFLPVMSDPKMAAALGSGMIPPPPTPTTTNGNMLLPSLNTTNDTMNNVPRLLVPPPIPATRRRSGTNDRLSPMPSVTEQIEAVRQSTILAAAKPSVDQVTEILRERRQKIKHKKR